MTNNEFDKINEFLIQDSESITTPPELKNQFFEKNGTLKKGIVIGYWNYIPHIVVFLSALCILYLLNFDKGKIHTTSVKNKSIPTIIQSDIQIVNDNKSKTINDISQNNYGSDVKENILEKSNNNYIQTKNEIIFETDNLQKEDLSKENSNEQVYVSKAEFYYHREINSDLFDMNVPKTLINLNHISTSDKQSDFAITFRGLNSVSNIDTELNEGFSAWNNNININIYFYRYKNLLLGAGLGRENLPQRYNGKIENKDVIITQNPNVYWGTLNARYYSDILPIRDLKPFIDAAIGITPYGSILRSNIGLEYNLNANTSVFLGADISNFSYSYQNNIFFTNKIGFSYGVKVEL